MEAAERGATAALIESGAIGAPAERRLSGWSFAAVRMDVLAGLTVALVAVPQCMGFAAIAGLPAIAGIYAAVVMGLVSAAVSSLPRLVIGPAITASTMCLAVLRTVAPDQPGQWPALAGLLAALVGVYTILGALLNVGRFVRFVSHSVIVGLMAGSAILTIGTQLAPALGVPSGREPMLAAILWNTLRQLPQTHGPSLAMAAATLALVLLGGRIGPRFPAAFLALALGGAAVWLLERFGYQPDLRSIGELAWAWPAAPVLTHPNLYQTDFLVGGAAIALVGIIQNLAIAKGLAARAGERVDAPRELWSLGLANVAAGFARGLPGSGSFARSALNDLAGARTRLAGVVAALATAGLVALGAPLAHYVTHAAIAGLLVATAVKMVDWGELLHVLRHDRYDRIVLGITLGCAFLLPIHWAILIGLAVSIAVFLRRVSELHLFEMVIGESQSQFTERPTDGQTGRSAVTMLQVEGPLFFAHADEFAERLARILKRGPRVLILRMRRTQQIDFSVIVALDRVVRHYLATGGRVILCGLQPKLWRTLHESPLGQTLPPEFMLQTTREVFGSAHLAIGLADSIARLLPDDGRPLYRTVRPG